MDCALVPGSIETVARKVMGYANGCSVVTSADGEDGNPIDCTTTLISIEDWLLRAYDGANGVFLDISVAVTAELCEDKYVARAQCDGPVGLAEMFKETIIDPGDGTATIRALFLTDMAAECSDCSTVAVPVLTRIISSFVRFGGVTYVLVASWADAGEAPLTCANGPFVPLSTLLAGALSPAGDCGMWAWRIA